MKEEKQRTEHTSLHSQDIQEPMRLQMVAEQIRARGIRDERVLAAMARVPRHLFVHPGQAAFAYRDHPLPIGYDQTISQPYIVAYMTEMVSVQAQDKVLEIGTGSGYQAAVLSELADKVYTVEIVEPLCTEAAERLARLEYKKVSVRCGDGFLGWPEEAPFDVIMLTASPAEIPQPLIAQLATGGRMILPLGAHYQELVLITRDQKGQLIRKNLIPVRFVPMTGKIQQE